MKGFFIHRKLMEGMETWQNRFITAPGESYSACMTHRHFVAIGGPTKIPLMVEGIGRNPASLCSTSPVRTKASGTPLFTLSSEHARTSSPPCPSHDNLLGSSL